MVLLIAGGVLAFLTYALPYIRYQDAVATMNRGEYNSAIEKFDNMNGYLDSAEQKTECVYKLAIDKYYERNYSDSADLFSSLIGIADEYLKEGKYFDALEMYIKAGVDYKTNDNAKKCTDELYQSAVKELNANNLTGSYEKFAVLGDYKKSKEYANECQYRLAERYYKRGEYKKAIDIDEKLDGIQDLTIVLSAAADEDTPAVWEIYDGVCQKCQKKAQYIFEFYQSGKFKFEVECDNGCEIEEMTGKFKIESKKLYLSEYVRGILTWKEAADIKSIKTDTQSVDGKNTAIVMTDPLNKKNKKTITLYGNNISDSTISIE